MEYMKMCYFNPPIWYLQFDTAVSSMIRMRRSFKLSFGKYFPDLSGPKYGSPFKIQNL